MIAIVFEAVAPTSDPSQCSNQPGARWPTVTRSSTPHTRLLKLLLRQTAVAATPAPLQGVKLFILDHLCDLMFRLSIFLNMDSLQTHSSPIKREDRGDLRDLVWSADNIRK